MWSIASLTFAAPWALAAIAALPLLWWLLRVVPPSPRRQSFPAIALLFGLNTALKSAARTPWWLVALRLLVALLVILGVAHPLRDSQPISFNGPLLLAVDDGWATARGWDQRHALMDNLLDEAARSGRSVALVTTAPPPDGGPITATGPLPVERARSLVDALRPLPWPVDRAAATRALSAITKSGPMRVVWVADGISDPGAQDFGRALSGFGSVEISLPPPSALARVLLPPRSDPNGDLVTTIRRASALGPERATLRASDASGHSLAIADADFAAGSHTAEARFSLPTELRNRIASMRIDAEQGASAVALLDESAQRHPVGLVDEGGGGDSPLLDDLYYVERALAPFAEVRRGTTAALLQRELSFVVMPDRGNVPQDQIDALSDWVSKGGVLLRLAGPELARNPDDLLPVQLLGGGRTLGGAMSWTQPMAVAPMPEKSPFAGLVVPPDLKINSQVLAEPSVDLDSHTWARLTDGTPLVTGAPLGKGWLVLLHTTVWPEWSNLGLSGLLPEMLQRLLALSQGVGTVTPDRPLPPSSVLDGFGDPAQPSGIVEPLPAGAATVTPGPRHPPGLYGDATQRVAFNLGPALAPPEILSPPQGARIETLGEGRLESDLQPPLLIAALLLLLADLAIALMLRGRISRRAVAAGLAAIIIAGAVIPAQAQNAPSQNAPQPSPQAVAGALDTRLAYVVTGDPEVDATSRAGLEGLTQILARRTTAQLAEPDAVTPGKDDLAVYPLLYWPVTASQGALPQPERDAVNDYMRRGGMILFDSRDGGADSGPLRALTQGLDIPPLAEVNQNHVLTHSFYILRTLPGRLSGAPVYVAAGDSQANDDVSPVVIGANDWAGAWAIDDQGRALFAVVPGGENQRELAYRFGVNVVMYAMTGSYKADQVHLPALLERLGE